MENFCFDTPKRDCFLKQTVILGRGSYGIVFKATYKEKKAAVKIISKYDQFKFSSLNRERNVLNVNNQHIIKILKIVELREYGAIIMERFENAKNLQFLLDHCEKINLFCRLKILLHITSALKFCHENIKIVHRDLKPDNIMVVLNENRNDFTCKLFDFGCSFKINEYEICQRNKVFDHLEDNFDTSIVGTVRYSAPELLQGSAPSPSIDIYSLGIIMWQLKINEIPYETIKSNEIIIWQVVRNNLRPDSTILLLNKLSEIESQINSRTILRKSNLIKIDDVDKTFIKSFTPTKKLLNVLNNKKSSKSDFKHEKFISKCAAKSPHQISRKSLFKSKFLDTLNDDEMVNNCGDEFIDILIQLLTKDPLDECENSIQIENEYRKLYKACWDANQLYRPDIEKIYNLVAKLINDC